MHLQTTSTEAERPHHCHHVTTGASNWRCKWEMKGTRTWGCGGSSSLTCTLQVPAWSESQKDWDTPVKEGYASHQVGQQIICSWGAACEGNPGRWGQTHLSRKVRGICSQDSGLCCLDACEHQCDLTVVALTVKEGWFRSTNIGWVNKAASLARLTNKRPLNEFL